MRSAAGCNTRGGAAWASSSQAGGFSRAIQSDESDPSLRGQRRVPTGWGRESIRKVALRQRPFYVFTTDFAIDDDESILPRGSSEAGPTQRSPLCLGCCCVKAECRFKAEPLTTIGCGFQAVAEVPRSEKNRHSIGGQTIILETGIFLGWHPASEVKMHEVLFHQIGLNLPYCYISYIVFLF